MLLNLYNLISISVMTLSTMGILSVTSAFVIWMLMEINTTIMYLLMTINKSKWSSIIAYFLIQSSSSLLIMAYVISCECPANNSQVSLMYSLSMSVALMMKLGMFPFHFWPPYIFNQSNWFVCFILMTIQKLPPFLFIPMLSSHSLINASIIPSCMIAAINNLYTTKVKKIMGFSSTIHTSWMVMIININWLTWMVYMMMYTIMMKMISNLMIYMNMSTPNLNFMKMSNLTHEYKMFMSLLTISLMGIPPSSMFIIKMAPLSVMMFNNYWMITMFLVWSSIISVIFYLRLILMSLMMSYPSTSQLMKKLNLNSVSITLYMFTLIFLSMIILIYWMLL